MKLKNTEFCLLILCPNPYEDGAYQYGVIHILHINNTTWLVHKS